MQHLEDSLFYIAKGPVSCTGCVKRAQSLTITFVVRV